MSSSSAAACLSDSAARRITLDRSWFRATVGQYQERTYSHPMRITNLLLDIMWLIGIEIFSGDMEWVADVQC